MKVLLLFLAPLLVTSLKFKQFLKSTPRPGHKYLVYFSFEDYERCSTSERQFFEDFRKNEFESTTILESMDVGLMMAFGVQKRDLPTYRLFENGKIYSLLSVESEALFSQENRKLELQISLPLSHLEFSLLPFQHSRYVDFTRLLIGAEKKSNLSVLVLTIILFGVATFFTLRLVLSKIKGLGEKDLNRKNILTLFGLWMLVKVLLMPADTIDLMYHHNWKLIVYNFPVEDYYKPVCFGFDYPPLFLLFQGFWGTVFGFITPQDMRFENLFKESNLFFILIRLSVMITDVFYFWAVLSLMRTISAINKAQAKKQEYSTTLPINVLIFAVSLFDTGLLAIDNANCQYNSFLFGITLFSINFMLQKRYLLGAFIYCIVVLTKHITLYYGFGYFAFLLLNYCVTFSKSGFQINLLNTVKLGSIVLSTFVAVLYPFKLQFGRMLFLLGGGNNNPLGYPVPNFQFLYSLSELVFQLNYTHVYLIPGPLKFLLLLTSYLLILKLVYNEHLKPHLPFYMYLSGLAIFNFMNYAHEKHLLYMWIPLLVHGLLAGGKMFELVIELKMFNSLIILNHLYNMELLTIKYPFLLCALLMTRHFLPHKVKKYALYILLNEVPYDLGMVFLRVQIPHRFFVVFIMGMQLYYEVIKAHLKKN